MFTSSVAVRRSLVKRLQTAIPPYLLNSKVWRTSSKETLKLGSYGVRMDTVWVELVQIHNLEYFQEK